MSITSAFYLDLLKQTDTEQKKHDYIMGAIFDCFRGSKNEQSPRQTGSVITPDTVNKTRFGENELNIE